LAFAANSPIGEKLTEGRFRSYWDRTAEHGKSNERIRFKAVLDLIQAEGPSLPTPFASPPYCGAGSRHL
jgi:hypothetical protein